MIEYTKPEFIREIIGKRISNSKVGLFKCMCGKEFEAVISRVNASHRPIKSCGCAQKAAVKESGHNNKTHGKSGTTEYNIFKTMKARCYNPNNWLYETYGGRGIKICERWLNTKNGFENFLADVGPRPGKEYSIDRINNDGDYEPSNVKWSTAKEQCRNRTDNRFIEYKGHSKTVAEWGELTGLGRKVIEARLDHYKWSIEDTLTIPKMKNQYSVMTERIEINL